MSEPKKQPKKMGRPPIDRPKMPNAVSIRGSQEWRDWLARIAEHQRTTPTSVIDQALAELARRIKFESPPKRI